MSRHPRARLFVAAELPSAAREELADWARAALAGPARHAVRLLDPELLHVTLCFLGSRPVAEIDALGPVVSRLHSPACEATLGAPLWLPARRPKVLAIELTGAEGLAELQRRVTDELAMAIDWQPERRRFRAHVTVARVRGGGAVDARARLPATPALSVAIEAVSLQRSWLSPAGARYETLARCELGAGI
ncbi:MAG TPA: RNA 2',3'-cyclic phosphodiesterase [Solirubrobacteraceae bacterium]|nr:RNA 2',3'-cyclic phosphodiesterase [Solirubrobacteraceae bacterium]